MRRSLTLPLLLLAACASKQELATLREETQKQQVQLAQLEETVRMQGERLDAQSAILERLDDARGAEAPEPGVEAPAWLQVDGDRVVVTRAHLPDVEHLAREFRSIPHQGPSGDADGFKLLGIRPGSPLDHLGLRNGDIVHRVAGVEVSTLDGVMQAYQQVMAGGRFEVALTRRGSGHTLVFEVR